MPKGVNNIMKYYDDDNVFKSGTPRHVRASIVHNQMLEKLNIKSIPPITDGNKIKFVELKLPNPTTQPVIAFDTFLPSEFGLNEYVDYDKILRASFKKPLQIFLDSIGWENERTNTLF